MGLQLIFVVETNSNLNQTGFILKIRLNDFINMTNIM